MFRILMSEITTEQYAPASGTVEEVNEALSEQPQLLNKSPEEDGRILSNDTFQCLTKIRRLALQNQTIGPIGTREAPDKRGIQSIYRVIRAYPACRHLIVSHIHLEQCALTGTWQKSNTSD